MQTDQVSTGATTANRYTAGSWIVEAGQEERFIASWTRFTGWSLENAPGAHEFVLIRDEDDPRHFLSFGAWTDERSVDSWKQTPEFAELLGACRALCTDFTPGNYSVAAEIR